LKPSVSVPLQEEVLGGIIDEKSFYSQKNESPNFQTTDKRYILNGKAECPN